MPILQGLQDIFLKEKIYIKMALQNDALSRDYIVVH